MSRRTWPALILGLVGLVSTTVAQQPRAVQYNFADTRFTTVPLGQGAYALMPDEFGITSAGFVVGDSAVLVVDAHMTPRSAYAVLQAVRRVSSLPVRYLVNTNSHGDHTFGNSTFPTEVTVVAHVDARDQMRREFESEKVFFERNTQNGAAELAGVSLRLPTLTFTERLTIDLGNQPVVLWAPGPATTGGDIVVWVPAAGAVFAGNLAVGAQSIQPANAAYAGTLRHMLAELQPRLVVPGHGLGAGRGVAGPELLEEKIRYGDAVSSAVRELLASGVPADSIPLRLPLGALRGVEAASWREILPGGHAQNVRRVARELAGSREPAVADSGAATGAGILAAYLRDLDDLERKYAALAGAFPDAAFEWRPSAGVRSVREVVALVTAENAVLVPATFGQPVMGAVPAEFQRAIAAFTARGRADLLADLSASFAHVRATWRALGPADFERRWSFFGGQMTASRIALTAMLDQHEHLGQLIAYARSSGVVPPWSAPRAQR